MTGLRGRHAHERCLHLSVPAAAEFGAGDFVAPRGRGGKGDDDITGALNLDVDLQIADRKAVHASAERSTSRTGSPAVTWIRAGSKPNCLASTCTSCEALAREGDALNPNETAAGGITTAKQMNRRMRHPTTMRPVIFGWIEQKYLYAPGVSNRWENCSSVSSTGDLNFCSVLTTL